MQHISKYLDGDKPKPRSTAKSTETCLPASWVTAIFEKMRIRYRQLWTKSLGTDPLEIKAVMDEWRSVLGSITPDQLKHGLEAWDSGYPPNVMQFKAACLEARTTAAHKRYKALPMPTPDKAKGLQALKEARAKIDEQSEPEAHKEASRMKPAGPEWFKSHGWRAYKPGEEDLLKMKGLR